MNDCSCRLTLTSNSDANSVKVCDRCAAECDEWVAGGFTPEEYLANRVFVLQVLKREGRRVELIDDAWLRGVTVKHRWEEARDLYLDRLAAGRGTLMGDSVHVPLSVSDLKGVKLPYGARELARKLALGVTTTMVDSSLALTYYFHGASDSTIAFIERWCRSIRFGGNFVWTHKDPRPKDTIHGPEVMLEWCAHLGCEPDALPEMLGGKTLMGDYIHFLSPRSIAAYTGQGFDLVEASEWQAAFAAATTDDFDPASTGGEYVPQRWSLASFKPSEAAPWFGMMPVEALDWRALGLTSATQLDGWGSLVKQVGMVAVAGHILAGHLPEWVEAHEASQR